MRINSFFFRFATIFCALSVSLACNEPNPQLPLHEEEIRILTDVMLVEGVIQDFSGEKKDSIAFLNYDVLYDRHGITEEDLQQLRRKYSEDPTLWSRATDSIIARLKRGRTDFETLLNPELN